MQSLKTLSIAAVLLGLGLHAAAAQEVTITTTAPADIPGAFDTLPPGGKSIAESLYTAQTGPTFWTRDQIATAKMSGDGWGQIFHEMKRDGLITEKSLGQVIRRDAAVGHHVGGSVSRSPHREITVTTGNGTTRVLRTGNTAAGRGNHTAMTTGNGSTTTGHGSHGASAASSAHGGAFAAGHSGGHGGGHGNGGASRHGR